MTSSETQTINRLYNVFIQYKEDYTILKNFKQNFNPDYINSLFMKLDDRHPYGDAYRGLYDRNSSSFELDLHRNMMCCCDVVEAIFPSLNNFTIAMKEFYKLYDSVKHNSSLLAGYYERLKKICMRHEMRDEITRTVNDVLRYKADEITEFNTVNEEAKEFFRSDFKKSFEQAFKCMRKCMFLFEIYMEKVMMYERLEIM